MNLIKFVEPTVHHNNYGVSAEGDDLFIKKFDYLMEQKCTARFTNDPMYDEKKSFGAFHQGSDGEWSYWEFWHDQTLSFRRKCLNFVEEIKREIETKDWSDLLELWDN